jgi:uncharacterized protein (DUF983 family)
MRHRETGASASIMGASIAENPRLQTGLARKSVGEGKVPNDAQNKVELAVAVWRGLRGRCPRCGQGRILGGYIAPVDACVACGENLAPYRTADFAPYLVVFVIGLIFTPLTIALSMNSAGQSYAIVVIMAAAVVTALLLLPRAKGAAIALLWVLGVRSNQ